MTKEENRSTVSNYKGLIRQSLVWIRYICKKWKMKYSILFILISSITITSCQIKKTIINISPNLGNPLTLDKKEIYCVDSYNKTKEETILTKSLKNKLKVLDVQLGNDCKFKLMVEIIIDKSINSKNIPVNLQYAEKINTRKGNESNYSKTEKSWNDFGVRGYKESNISVLLYIDVYDTNKILINSVNSFSDKSIRETVVPVSSYINGENKSYDRKNKSEYQKSVNPKYPIYSSVNRINMNHILDLDDKILTAKNSGKKIHKLTQKWYSGTYGKTTHEVAKLNNEDPSSRNYYTRRCKQNYGESSEMMSVGQLYNYLALNSFDKFIKVNDIGKKAFIFWNTELKTASYVTFYEPVPSWTFEKQRKTDNYPYVNLYADFFKEHKTYVYNRLDRKYICKKVYCEEVKTLKDGEVKLKGEGSKYCGRWDLNLESNVIKFKNKCATGLKKQSKYFTGSFFATNYMCTESKMKELKFGTAPDFANAQINDALTNIKINVK